MKSDCHLKQVYTGSVGKRVGSRFDFSIYTSCFHDKMWSPQETLSFCLVFRKSGAITQACRGHAWRSTAPPAWKWTAVITSRCKQRPKCISHSGVIFLLFFYFFTESLAHISCTCHFIALHLWFGLEMHSLSNSLFLTPVTPAYSPKIRFWSKTTHWERNIGLHYKKSWHCDSLHSVYSLWNL